LPRVRAAGLMIDSALVEDGIDEPLLIEDPTKMKTVLMFGLGWSQFMVLVRHAAS
jgi:hypothetical protein